MKILIVDDDRLIHEMMGAILLPLGYEIEHAFDTTDAMNIFIINSDFDLVITDIVMPGEDGTKLIKQIKSIRPNIPVLAVTGGIENAVNDYVTFASMYSDFTLAKPFSKVDLKKGIQTAIDRAAYNASYKETEDDPFENLQNILSKYEHSSTSS